MSGCCKDPRALLHVRLHITRLAEARPALDAPVGPDPRMMIEMRLEVMILGKCLPTQMTFVRTHTRMQTLMQEHVASVRKALLAHYTAVRFFPGVGSQVLSEEHLAAEGFGTEMTGVGLVSRVDPSVHVVGDSLIEALGAPLALVLLGVPVDLEMAGEIALVVEGLSADGTSAGKLTRAFMARAMVAEVSELGKVLLAIIAMKNLLLLLLLLLGSLPVLPGLLLPILLPLLLALRAGLGAA